MDLDDSRLLTSLNCNLIYDATPVLNNYLHTDDDMNTFSDINLSSAYHNFATLLNLSLENNHAPLVLSINIQSLQSKFNNLRQFVNDLLSHGANIDVIALQEIWDVPFHNFFNIPGFHPLVYETRKNARGGGVGFYVNCNLRFKQINLTQFQPNIFENLSIEIYYHNRKILFSNIYRSPTPLIGTSPSTHIEQFLHNLETHLDIISNHKSPAYLTLDANINLHNLHTTNHCNEYLNIITSNGFLQTITKSTRIQDNTHSLIDHVLTNNINNLNNAGTFITDISDHFCNFFFLNDTKPKPKMHIRKIRDFSLNNKNRFRNQLRNIRWNTVLNCNDVNNAFDLF
jgi:hypothetical protein